jgi:TonB family protein
VTPKASRRLLFIAIAVSVFLHALLAGWFRMPFAQSQGPKEVLSISRARIVRIFHATPPPHTPAPQPSPTARGSAAPRPVATGGRGASKPVTPAPPTPTPLVAPTAAALACTKPNAPAGLAATPVPEEIPAAARAAGTNGTTTVDVHLKADGGIESAAIASSSGNSSLDMVALSMAKSAQYVPAYKDCKPIAADYGFTAKWVAW